LAVILAVHLDFPAHLHQTEPQPFTNTVAKGLCPAGTNADKMRFSLQQSSSKA
jgi:hypothetical protein